MLELYQNYSSKRLLVSGVYVPVYNELSTKRAVFVSQPIAFLRGLAENAITAIQCQGEDMTHLVVVYLQALVNLIQQQNKLKK